MQSRQMGHKNKWNNILNNILCFYDGGGFDLYIEGIFYQIQNWI